MWKTLKNKFRAGDEHTAERAAYITALFVIGILMLVLTMPVVAYNAYHAQHIYPGVAIDGVQVGGKTTYEARALLQSYVQNLDQRGVPFRAGGMTVALTPTQSGINDPDLTYEIIGLYVDEMIADAYSFGRSSNIVVNAAQQARALFGQEVLPLQFFVAEDKLRETLQLHFGKLEDPGQNAQLVFEGDRIEVQPAAAGRRLDYDGALQQVRDSLTLVGMEPIEVALIDFVPSVSQADVEARLDEVRAVLDAGRALVVAYDGTEWTLQPDTYRDYLEFIRTDEGAVELTFNREKLTAYVTELAGALNTEPTDAILCFNDDKTEVLEFVPQRSGRTVNIEQSVDLIIASFFTEGQREGAVQVELVVDEAVAEIELADLNDLGITELLAIGESDYSGSPVNRRHNIEVGRKSYDGILLAPGEEFSALKYLGAVDASNGYLPELVIKGNETKPEYGGGLCQVSTTMFRAALNAGLDITERRNHSYTVSYYSPIGTDATIYDPAPDFKFKNDTGHHILIHTINDTARSRLVYEIWGTSDGRKVEMTDPVTYDWVAAPPTKIIETTDLPVGQKKCTEAAHAGVKAYFDRFITRGDGTQEEERFHSNYRPWQAVCLVGVESLSTDEETTSPQGEGEVTEDTETPGAEAVIAE